jgi:translation initiation factor IF-3
VISETGEQLGVLSTRDAIDRARDVGLDLVEVAPQSVPPVCKILDFGKYKYQMQKKEQQAKKRQHVSELKEVRMRPKTDTHDVQIKMGRAREFLEDGCKVQFTMIFRGREQLYRDIGRATFNDIVAKLDDVAKLDRDIRVEGKRMIMIMVPKGPPKKVKTPRPQPEGGAAAENAPLEDTSPEIEDFDEIDDTDDIVTETSEMSSTDESTGMENGNEQQ